MEYGARFVVGVVVGVVVFHRPIGWLRQVETSTISCGPLIQIDLYLSFICPCGGLEKHSILGHVHRRRGVRRRRRRRRRRSRRRTRRQSRRLMVYGTKLRLQYGVSGIKCSHTSFEGRFPLFHCWTGMRRACAYT